MNFVSRFLSIRSRLMLMLILVSAISSLVLIYIGYKSGKEAINTSIAHQLTSIKAAKKYQIESYFNQIENITEVLGENESIKEALKDFKAGFRKIEKNAINVECTQQLSNHYVDFVEKVSQNLDIKNNTDLFYPNTAEACYLQFEYIVDNPNPPGEKHLMVDAKDNSEYNKAHKKYHDYFTSIIQKFGFYDLFLIDLERGDIVYSVYKETDFATNLFNGPYRESNLADLVRLLKGNSDIRKSTIIDFETYRPSYGAPAAFIGIPISEGMTTIGALVFQLPVDEINKIMTGDNNWQADGLGESGETYLIGEDYMMRSISRFYLQDTLGFSEAMLQVGLQQEDIDRMYRLSTTIINHKVKTKGVINALAGEEDTRIIDDYRGVPVLSSYAPLVIRDLNWVILSEIDESEINKPIKDFQKKVFIALCVIVLFVTFLAMYLAAQFVRPIELLSEGVKRLTAGDYENKIEVTNHDEFGELATSFNRMVSDINKQQKIITQQGAENEKLLYNFIPQTIAQRLMNGEKQIVDTYPNASIIHLQMADFDKMTTLIDPKEVLHLLNNLLEAMDNAAEKHQVDRIRTIGDSYIAVCGMFSPRLDHAKKIFEFAIEIRQLTAQFNINYNTQLSMHYSIFSGEIHAGIMGKDKFSFDLWGPAINGVQRLNKIGEMNKIYVAENVKQKLENYYVFEKVSLEKISPDFEVWKYAEKRVKQK